MSIYLFSRIVIISFPLQFQQKMTGEAEERRAETKKNREEKRKSEGGGAFGDRTSGRPGADKYITMKDASAYWRLAGMSYLKYANLVRMKTRVC